MKITKRDVSVTKYHWGYSVSAMINGFLVTRKYVLHSRSGAVRNFLQDVKKECANG